MPSETSCISSATPFRAVEVGAGVAPDAAARLTFTESIWTNLTSPECGSYTRYMRQPDCPVNTLSDVPSNSFKATCWLRASVMTVGDQDSSSAFCLSANKVRAAFKNVFSRSPLCCLCRSRSAAAFITRARPPPETRQLGPSMLLHEVSNVQLPSGAASAKSFSCVASASMLHVASGVCGTRPAGSARGLGICNTAKGSPFSASAEEAFCLPSTVECEAEPAAVFAPGSDMTPSSAWAAASSLLRTSTGGGSSAPAASGSEQSSPRESPPDIGLSPRVSPSTFLRFCGGCRDL